MEAGVKLLEAEREVLQSQVVELHQADAIIKVRAAGAGSYLERTRMA